MVAHTLFGTILTEEMRHHYLNLQKIIASNTLILTGYGGVGPKSLVAFVPNTKIIHNVSSLSNSSETQGLTSNARFDVILAILNIKCMQ